MQKYISSFYSLCVQLICFECNKKSHFNYINIKPETLMWGYIPSFAWRKESFKSQKFFQVLLIISKFLFVSGMCLAYTVISSEVFSLRCTSFWLSHDHPIRKKKEFQTALARINLLSNAVASLSATNHSRKITQWGELRCWQENIAR